MRRPWHASDCCVKKKKSTDRFLMMIIAPLTLWMSDMIHISLRCQLNSVCESQTRIIHRYGVTLTTLPPRPNKQYRGADKSLARPIEKNPLEKFSPQFFGIKTASSSLIILQRAKLSTRITTHLCWFGRFSLFPTWSV
jgi:hypothetical protein